MHGVITLRGRKRNIGAIRDGRGASIEHERRQRIDYESRLARRGLHLEAEGIDPSYALDARSGYSLGRLFLRYKAHKADPGAISGAQFHAGTTWCRVIHRHAAIMGYKLTIPSMEQGGGGKELSDEEIGECRSDYRASFDALMSATRDHGAQVWRVTYGICIENWPIGNLQTADYGALRIGLNAIKRVLIDAKTKSVHA